MSPQMKLTVRLEGRIYDALNRTAEERGTDMAKLVRQLITQELSGAPDRAAEQREQLLFLAIAADNFLAAQPDQRIRETTIQMWRDRLAEEGRPDAA